jgi:CheY-like chemotaxis protein
LKFTEAGGVRVTLACEREQSAPHRHLIGFRVDDSGPGMSEGELRQLFEPFRKGDAGHRHMAGAGLGLAISYELVSLMGGKLWVQSQPDAGASFGFEISTHGVTETDPASRSLEPGTSGDRFADPAETGTDGYLDLAGAPLLVAAVDDDPDILQMHQEILTHLGANVRTFTTPEDLLADPDGGDTDLLIVDYELERTTGAALAGRCRQQWSESAMPRVAVISGHAAPENLPPGIDEWLQKPVELSRWIMLLASARHHRRVQRRPTLTS